MTKAKIVLSVVTLSAMFAGILSFKGSGAVLRVHQLKNGQCFYLGYYAPTSPSAPTLTIASATVTITTATTIASTFCSVTVSVAAE